MQKERVLKGLLKRRVSITKALLVTFLITGGLSLAGTIGEAQNEIDTNNKLTAGTYTGESSGSIISTKTDTSFEGDVKFNVVSTGEETRLDLNGQNVKVNSLVVRINPKEGAHSRPKGIWLRGNSKATIENLNVDIALRSKITGSKYSADSNAAYGVALGIDDSVHGAGSSSDESHLTVNNMNIVVKNTEDTIVNVYEVKKVVNIPFLNIPYTAVARVDFTHQLSGLRLTRKDGAKTTFISNGKVDIKVEDASATKSGDYLAGMYISGKEASATFNGETNISIIGEGINSAAIKIGKPTQEFDKATAPKIIFNGKMNIDTTKAKNSPAIRLFTNNVSLEVTGKNNEEASVINSGNTAIAFDVQDYVLKFIGPLGRAEVSRNSNATGQSVKLNNTEIRTMSETDSLILVKGMETLDGSLGEARKFEGSLNSGEEFTNKDATFELSGEKSIAKAATNGWLIEATGTRTASSSLTATIKDKAMVEGLTSKDFSSRLDINLENEAKWTLRNKGNINRTSFNNLTITNSILDASNINKENKAEYILGATTDGNAEDGKVTNKGMITLDNGKYEDKLILNGTYKGDNGKILVNTLWNETSGVNGENSKSDLFEITGTVEGKTEVITIDSNKSENMIDGLVGADEGDEGHRSAIVIKTPEGTAEGAFFGKAKTENETELELKSEVKDGNRLFFWEITKLGNNEPDLFLVATRENMDQSRNIFGRLNERRIQTKLFNIGKDTKYPMAWFRLFGGEHIQHLSKKTSYMDGTIGMNVGFDYHIDPKKENLTGVYFGYSNSFKHVMNKLSNEYKGKVTTNMYSLGFTNTYEIEKFYADAVVQVSALRNEYKFKNDKKYNNTGVIFTGSLEVGSPIYFENNKERDEKYIVEPQAQIIYQFGKNMDIVEQKIGYGYSNSITGRMGLRLGYSTSNHNKYKNGMGYALFNVWGQWTDGNKVTQGKKEYVTDYAKVWLEAGLGANIPVTKNVSSYFEVSLEKSVYGGNKYGGKGTIGFNIER